jgi:hypothetical protein
VAWQPSDGDAGALSTIAERCGQLPNVGAPWHLDLLALRGDAAGPALPVRRDALAEAPLDTRPDARVETRFDAVFAANLLHISPWPTCAALVRLAAAQLRAGGVLVLYGPFEVEGEPLAPGNRAFDADLRARDARWGLRRMGDGAGRGRTRRLRVRAALRDAGQQPDAGVAAPRRQ